MLELMLQLLLRAGGMSSPVLPQPTPPAATTWVASVASGAERYATDDSAWKRWLSYEAIVRAKRQSGSLGLETQRTQRFGLWDQSYAVDAYKTFDSRSYGNLRVLFTPSAHILPRSDVSLELFRGVGAGYELSVGWRQMVFADGTTRLVGAAVARSFADYYARVRLGALIGEGGGASATGMLRRTPNDSRLFEIAAGIGEEVVSLNSSGQIDIRPSASGSGRVEWYFGPAWGLGGLATVNAQQDIPTRWGLQVTALRRW